MIHVVLNYFSVGPVNLLFYNVLCISKGEMARLRLQAGCCMLKLAQEPGYADAISLKQFQTVALLASVSYVLYHCTFVS